MRPKYARKFSSGTPSRERAHIPTMTHPSRSLRGSSSVLAEVKNTAGTNSREEKAALLQRLHRLLVDTLDELAEASYIVIHELPAENWGYAGLTQAARAAGKL